MLRFHTREYLDRIVRMSGSGDAGEAVAFRPNSDEVARLASGGCVR
ncbi:hypothetical protein [Pelagibacterium halotolerans]